jgi:transposase
MPKENGMEAYSLDLRKRVLAACDAGHGTKEVAALFDVSPAWVRRLKQRRRERGTIEPLPGRYGQPPKLNEDHLRRLSHLVEQHPDATLRELREHLEVRIGLSNICRALQRLKLSFKKKSCTPPNRTARTSRNCGGSGTGSSRA